MKVTNLIYDMVSMHDVLNRYHRTGKRGRVDCPIHNGKDNNFCYTDKVYHCWVCGAKGNVIDFVMTLFRLPYIDACRKLNEDFNLNIPIDGKINYEQRREMNIRLANMRTERYNEIRQKEAEDKRYNALMDEYVRLDLIREGLAPKTPDEPINELYAEAMQKLPFIEYRLDSADWRHRSD